MLVRVVLRARVTALFITILIISRSVSSPNTLIEFVVHRGT